MDIIGVILMGLFLFILRRSWGFVAMSMVVFVALSSKL